MSCLLSPVTNEDNFATSSLFGLSQKKHHRGILKHKENTYKYRCRKALKRKLKKYKLRHDGSEDPEVLDVSEILIKSLKIKSPISKTNNHNNNCIFDENLPKNYLFKMGRRKKIVKNNENSDLNSPIASQSPDKETNSLPLCNGKEKQQTNAFKLLMDSRNKSIGSNSPGKEKVLDENEIHEVVEKKTIKAKRNLALQKMAEAKGSLKKKEMEEYEEECIKKKMEKRAERLKNMIINNKSIKTEKPNAKDHRPKLPKEPAPSLNKQEDMSKQKTLTIINLFNDPITKNNISPEKNVLTKEDNDFLKKLSPSLKKKENMMCYFKKLEKEIPLCTDVENENLNEDVVIKVKLVSKSKKKAKKKKLSTNKIIFEDAESQSGSVDNSNELSSDVPIECEQLDSKISKDNRKRKRHDNLDSKVLSNNNIQEVDILLSERRPKRNVKKPVKYTDDIETFSSDDDLHIFTPKKKRHSEDKIPNKQSTKADHAIRSKSTTEIDIKPEKADVNLKSKHKAGKKPDKADPKLLEDNKKNVKLAPIFAAKPQLDAAAIEAKQKFLQSGVPDKLKKNIADQKNKNVELSIFPVTVHVQQNTNFKLDIPTCPSVLWSSEDNSDDELNISLQDSFKNIVINLLDKRNIANDLTLNYDKHTILQNIKKMYPKFPVFRTYRLLKDKKLGVLKECSYQELDNSVEIINGINEIFNENPEKLNWTDKYKATSTKHIFGNFASIRELRKWLITWTENEAKSRNRVNIESDSSDFYQSDTDSKESFKSNNNLLIITGPVGCGKTSSVYAVATELAIKVIEVNASSKRTGKIMLQDLQEATQSHKVNRGKGSAENSQKSQEISEDSTKPLKKKGRPKKHTETSSKSTVATVNNENVTHSQPTNSQDSVRTEMSLILIDDADIVFEQDDGFCSAIVQLAQSSKRPVILISSSSSCTHLQRFLQSAKIIKMYPLQPRMLGTWLDLMCFADTSFCVPGTGSTILDFFKGDIRRAINTLQFYVSSQIQTENEESSPPNSDPVPFMDDETSSMSWVDQESSEDKQHLDKSLESRSCKCIIGQQLTLTQYSGPLDLFNMWWSIPKLLINPLKSDLVHRHNIDKEGNALHTVVELEAIANALDSISVAEYYRPTKLAVIDTTCDPWFSVESDSVSENEHSFYYNSSAEVLDDISQRLISGSILEAQNIMKIEKSTDIQFPSMAVRRQRDKVVSRHHNLSSSLYPSAVLDRKALALDYWSSCRTICRLEKSKTDNKSKRNNRFCHYLKSLNVMCKTDYYDKLADSLDPSMCKVAFRE